MPRRRRPDPLAEAVGLRIRQLREEAGITQEKLAYESDLGSKGYLSDIEHGLALPSLARLQVLAERLGLPLLDLVTFPERDDRQALVDRTRALPRGALRKLLREISRARRVPLP